MVVLLAALLKISNFVKIIATVLLLSWLPSFADPVPLFGNAKALWKNLIEVPRQSSVYEKLDIEEKNTKLQLARNDLLQRPEALLVGAFLSEPLHTSLENQGWDGVVVPRHKQRGSIDNTVDKRG